MKGIIISFISLVFLSSSFANYKDMATGYSVDEFSSVRNFPVILRNEVLSNDRCRLHLDTGIKIDVSCKHSSASAK